MAGTKRRYTIYARDIAPTGSDAPLIPPREDVQALTNDESSASHIENENRRLKALLEQHGIFDSASSAIAPTRRHTQDVGKQYSAQKAFVDVMTLPDSWALQDDGKGHTSIERTAKHTNRRAGPGSLGALSPTETSSIVSTKNVRMSNRNSFGGSPWENHKSVSAMPPLHDAIKPEPKATVSTENILPEVSERYVQLGLGRSMLGPELKGSSSLQAEASILIDLSQEDEIAKSTIRISPDQISPEVIVSGQQRSQTCDGLTNDKKLEGDKSEHPQSVHELLPASAPFEHARITFDVFSKSVKMNVRSDIDPRKRWLPNAIVSAIRACREGDMALHRFLNRKQFPEFWFCARQPEQYKNILSYSICRRATVVEIGLHRGLPLPDGSARFANTESKYRALLRMSYDAHDKPWAFLPCTTVWTLQTPRLNQPSQGIALGDNDTTDPQAVAQLQKERADHLYHYIKVRTFRVQRRSRFECAWGHELWYDTAQDRIVGRSKKELATSGES